MNEKILCAIFDKKSKNYDGFMLFNKKTDAVRAFQMSCEKNEMFQKWPEDFEFYKVAIIITNNEQIEIKKSLEFLAAATHFVDNQKKDETATK